MEGVCFQGVPKHQLLELHVKFPSIDISSPIPIYTNLFPYFLYIYIEMMLFRTRWVQRFPKDTSPIPRIKEILCVIRHIHSNLKHRGYLDGDSI